MNSASASSFATQVKSSTSAGAANAAWNSTFRILRAAAHKFKLPFNTPPMTIWKRAAIKPPPIATIFFVNLSSVETPAAMKRPTSA